ncbi:mitochondria-eating protein isoform X1 [Hydra vulgaris]|uniref:Mitochondria-eating protein n=1 Tax=Hydra vulgaris TaxID=6087 RepID=A0ABM4BK10_HYDVU
MQYPDDSRLRVRSQPQAGRFTQTRSGSVANLNDPSLMRAQQYTIDRQTMMQQQARGSLTTTALPSRSRRPSSMVNGNASNEILMEMERMKRAIMSLQEQLAFAEDTITAMRLKEREANDRKAQDLQKQIESNGRFENLCQGATRPSQIVEKYDILYTQGRIDAIDDLDKIAGLSKYGKHQEMKQKVLYGIMVASYKVAYDYLNQLKLNIRRLLGIPEKYTGNEKDSYGEVVNFLNTYFQSTTQTFNVEPIVEDVQEQLAQLLPEFPSLSKLPGIALYTADCCRIAWAMVNQFPPMELEHSQEKFVPEMHARFHSSSEKSNKIKMYVWPCLVDSNNKSILYKGVVWT